MIVWIKLGWYQLGVLPYSKLYFTGTTHYAVEMTNNPPVPVVKHLLEQAERNAHLKETFTKSQNSKYISFPFINKIEQKSSKSFQQKIFLPLWQVKKKTQWNRRRRHFKSCCCWVFILNLATLQTWSKYRFQDHLSPSMVAALGLAGCCFLSQGWTQALLGNLSTYSALESHFSLPCSLEAPKCFP